MHECFCLDSVNLHLFIMSKTLTLQFCFSLSPEHQICRTNSDAESSGLEKLTKSNNQSKEGMYTLSRINSFPYYTYVVNFILNSIRSVELDSCISRLLYHYILSFFKNAYR